MPETKPCGMWLDVDGRRECGQPATLGWRSEESGALVPICEDCIAATKQKRRHLSPLEPTNAR